MSYSHGGLVHLTLCVMQGKALQAQQGAAQQLAYLEGCRDLQTIAELSILMMATFSARSQTSISIS